MIIFWATLSLLGIIVAVWYIKSTILNSHGRINYPKLLWKTEGHLISWFLIILGMVSVYMLYSLIPDVMMVVFKIAGGILISLVVIKIGMAMKMLPHFIVFVFALIGLIKYGLKGFLGGIALGFVVLNILGVISALICKLFDFGVVTKKYRIRIAKDFFTQHEKEILELGCFKTMASDKIIDIFGQYINQIFNESSQLRTPRKAHPFDSDFSGYKPNFIEGSKGWLNRFNNESERELMQKYVDFLANAFYEEYNKYA